MSVKLVTAPLVAAPSEFSLASLVVISGTHRINQKTATSGEREGSGQIVVTNRDSGKGGNRRGKSKREGGAVPHPERDS